MQTLARKEKTRAHARPAAAPAAGAAAGAGGASEGWEGGALVLLTLLAFSFGVVQLYSASAFLAEAEELPAHYFAVRQLLGGLLGAAAVVLLARMDYRGLRLLAWPFLAAMVFLLLLVILPGTEGIAPRVNGARRWLNLGFQFQPSEFAKLALIVWTAALAVKKQDRLHSLSKGLLPFLVVWLAVVVLVLLQPNMSAALLLMLLASLVLFAGGARIGHFILLGLVAVPVVWSQIKAAPYRVLRLIAYMNPEADTGGITYQIYQSLIAVGSGGLSGVGFGESRQKLGYLPEPHNDFFFSLVAEEWGILGIAGVAGLFLAFAVVGYRIASRAPDRFGYLLALGMTNLVAVSAFLHMGVALALLPTTGVSLPFMSYGRSALLTAFAAVGVLLSVARAGRQGAPAREVLP